MKKKDIIFFATIILSIIIVIALIILVVNSISSGEKREDKVVTIVDSVISDKKISKEDKELITKYETYQSNYYNSLNLEQKKTTIKAIDDVLKNINANDYAKIYTQLIPEYIDYKFKTEESFVKYMENTTKKANDYTCEIYNVKFYGDSCKLVSSVGEDIYILIKYNEYAENELSYLLMFDGDISNLTPMEELYIIGDLSFLLYYKIDRDYAIDYAFNIENRSNKSVNISFDELSAIILFSGVEKEESIVEKLEDITIQGKSTKQITMSFPYSVSDYMRPIAIKMKCKLNDKQYDEYLYLEHFDPDV